MILFDGHDLGQLFVVGEPVVGALSAVPDYRKAPSRDGRYVSDVVLDSPTVTVTLAATGSAAERRVKLSTLAMWLNVDGPRELVLPDLPDVRFMAVPDGALEPTRGIDGERGKLTFVLTEPAGYGVERTVTVPSGGTVTFTVGGTYPTRPTIEASAVRDSTSLVWGVRLDGDDFVHVKTGSAEARTVSIDCGARTCTVNGDAAMVTLDSDWLELSPGEHTLSMDNGTGAATVTYFERWL